MHKVNTKYDNTDLVVFHSSCNYLINYLLFLQLFVHVSRTYETKVSRKFISVKHTIERNCWQLHGAVGKMTPTAITTGTTKSTTGIPFHAVNNLGKVKEDVGLGISYGISIWLGTELPI